jgi:N-acetylneuraminic acid mutarotase
VPQAAVIGGKIYLPGGLTGHGNGFFATRTMAVYTVATNTWTTVDMPQYMTAQTVWTAGGALYVFGRCADEETSDYGEPGLTCWRTGAPLKFLLRYAPGTNSWTYLPTPPVDARENPVSGMIGGKAYVTAGGSAALDSYDPATGVWRGWQPLARARLGAAGDAVKGKLYVVGGYMRKPDLTLGESRAMTEYNPATNTWVNRAQVPELFGPVIRATRVVIDGQARLAILGGFGHHYQWAP